MGCHMYKTFYKHQVYLSMNIGIHALADFHRCDISVINDEKILLDVLRKLAIKFGFTIFESSYHKFYPQGVTCYLLVGESHLSIHTWPEYQHASVDIFSCKLDINIKDMLRDIKHDLQSKSVTYLITNRGTTGPKIIGEIPQTI